MSDESDFESDIGSLSDHDDDDNVSESDEELDNEIDTKKRKNSDNKKDKKNNKKVKQNDIKTDTKISNGITVHTKQTTTNNNNNNISVNNIPPPTIETDFTKGGPITTEASAKKLIISYLKQQNRPYSALQVYDNLHKRIQKPTVERVLNNLSEEKSNPNELSELKCKEYGKAKIYYYNQDKMMNELKNAPSIDELDQVINTLNENVNKKTQELKLLKQQVNELQTSLTDEELIKKIEELSNETELKKNKLSNISTKSIDKNALKNAITLHNKYRSLWSNRKMKCMDVIDMMSEGMNKNRKSVCNEVGVELDDEYNVTIPKTISDRI